jgi:hypothetical protein
MAKRVDAPSWSILIGADRRPGVISVPNGRLPETKTTEPYSPTSLAKKNGCARIGAYKEQVTNSVEFSHRATPMAATSWFDDLPVIGRMPPEQAAPRSSVVTS